MNEKKCDISVIIPMYKVQDFIVETLDRLVCQKIECDAECLLIDDCGGDASVFLAEEFIEKYNGKILFRIIHHEKNRGLSAARNTGIMNANGEYLYFLDGDDNLFPDCLQKLWKIVLKYPTIDVVKGDFAIEGFGDSILNKNLPLYTNDTNWIRTNMCNLSIPESACNCLVRRDLVVENALFFKEGWIQEDTFWAFMIQRYVKSLAFCFEATYFYRVNKNSIMHTMDGDKEANAYAIIYNEVYKYMYSSNIERCELRFLEIMAERVYKASGKSGMDLLCTNRNVFFNMLYWGNRKLEKEKNKLSILIMKIGRGMLRKTLCAKRAFLYNV